MDAQNLYAPAFGLTERPFTLLPDPEFIFWSKQHKQAFSVLEFGIMSRAPITLITGDVGSGKTTLLQHLLASLDETATVGLISNAQGGRGELMEWVLNSLSIDFDGASSYVPMFRKLQEFIIQEYAEGRRVVLIFDEAQNLSTEGLEELRMFTNINANKDELLQLILVGQPELQDLVRAPNMKQLAQRVAASFHLTAMDAKTTVAYISHRLTVAGGSGSEFSRPASVLVYEATNGVPRLVNQLCELAMLYAWGQNKSAVSVSAVRQVLEDGVFFGGNAADVGSQ